MLMAPTWYNIDRREDFSHTLFGSDIGTGSNITSYDWSEIENPVKITQKGCYFCKKKLTRDYTIKGLFCNKRKECSHCKYLYDFLKKQMTDIHSRRKINSIYNHVKNLPTGKRT